MSKLLLSFAALAALTVGAHAQAPASPPAPAAPPAAETKSVPQAAATPSTSDAATQAKPAGSDTATEWTYKTKDGQMYQPPEQRPASPAMETKTYGRT